MKRHTAIGNLFSGTKLLGFLLFVLSPLAKSSAQAPAIEWEKAIPAAGHSDANSICPTGDGGFMVAGTVTDTSAIDHKIRLVRLDAAGTELWRRDYGSPYPDEVRRVLQTADGGFLVSALVSLNGGDVSGHHGQYDIWLMKTSASGQLQWQRCYGGSRQETWADLAQTADGGYILCAGTGSADGDIMGKGNGGSLDGLVIKIASNGAIQWQKTYGGSGEDAFRTIVPAPGGYYVCGWSGSADNILSANNGASDAWIVKLDGAGSIVWQKTYGGSHYDVGLSVAAAQDGGCVAVGFTRSANQDFADNHGASGVADGWIVRLNAAGGEEWKRTLGGTGAETFDCIKATADGGFLVLGMSELANGDVAVSLGSYDIWLLRFSAAGGLDWQKALGGSSGDGLGAGNVEVIETADKGCALVSSTTSAGIPGILNPGQNLNNWYVARLEPPCDTVVAAHDTTVCAAALAQLTLGGETPGQPPYQWSDGSSGKTITISGTGTYWRRSGPACHLRVDTIIVRQVPALTAPELGPAVQACFAQAPRLGREGSGLRYRWSSGDTTATILPKQSGLYLLQVSNGCETAADSVLVELSDCNPCFLFPNAFTPNGDGRNDAFGPVIRCSASGYRLEIFNRWGQPVFVALQPQQGWDGTFKGGPVEPGSYFYSVSALDPEGRPLRLSGNLLLVR